ncbi:MAG: hypothetical protein IT361_02345 [Gemmatimonadaceae bacterium]|nr:hypothetical protein [Gemmatimonadaceae bacterium]
MLTVDITAAEPLVTALAAALGAAAAGPLLMRAVPVYRTQLLGASGAVASGVMFGAAYLIMASSMRSWPGITPLAAVVTVPVIFAAHRAMRRSSPLGAVSRRMALLHGIPEGIALGTALAAQFPLGLWVAVTIAAHNVAEGALFAARTRDTGVSMSLGRAMLLAFVDKLPQAAAAASSWLLVVASPLAAAPLFASAFAGLVYLVIAELLMEAYARIGRVGVALTVMAAGAVVAALGGR